jgi:hypothetical protein
VVLRSKFNGGVNVRVSCPVKSMHVTVHWGSVPHPLIVVHRVVSGQFTGTRGTHVIDTFHHFGSVPFDTGERGREEENMSQRRPLRLYGS